MYLPSSSRTDREKRSTKYSATTAACTRARERLACPTCLSVRPTTAGRVPLTMPVDKDLHKVNKKKITIFF